MRLSSLLVEAGLLATARGDAQVNRVILDSRQARPGDLFVAIRGTNADGHQYIPAALAGGCSAVVCEDAATVPKGTPHAVANDARLAAGLLAQAVQGWPGRRLTLTGVTGTNGKTTFTYLLRHLLESVGRRVAVVGTIAYDMPGVSRPAPNTTPDAVELAEVMAQAVAAGVTDLVMEVSSHALDQRRTAGLDFRVASFTNLTGDHLDYHGTMEAYLAAKRKLFEALAPASVAVLNRDDYAWPYAQQIAAATPARVMWYGVTPQADVSAEVTGFDDGGTSFMLGYQGRRLPVRTSLIGEHNVSNCLNAAAAGLALGLSLEAIAAALASVRHVPGRLQRVPSSRPFSVLVDYAHTDDALDNVLRALQPVAQAGKGRLLVVFGCGGDRDKTKRPRMAEVAEKHADAVFVTSDNPRTEEPQAILDEIVRGFSPAGLAKVRVDVDRKAAIGAAIASAGVGDVVLIAGKGHEDYQIIGKTKHHFDDVEVAAEALAD